MATNLNIPNQGLDGIRIQAEIETRDRAKTKRPTWAPAVVLNGELLKLCREIELLSADDKPVARVWAVFNDPKGRGAVIRNNFSKHPLEGMACRGFEMHAGEERKGRNSSLMTHAFMDEDGKWSVGSLRWGSGLDLKALQHNADYYRRHIEACPTRLKPTEQPQPVKGLNRSGAATLEEAVKFYSNRDDLSDFYKRQFAELDVKQFQKSLKDWTEREQRIRDPKFIQSVKDDEAKYRSDLARTLRRISKVEGNSNWWQDIRTHMTGLATARMLNFAGDVEPQRRKGSLITGCCCCCGRTLTDPISIERGIGPECIQGICTFDVRDLVRLKQEMIASHPDKGGTKEAFREAFAKYQAAKEAAGHALTY